MIENIKYSWYFMHMSSFVHSVAFVFRNEEKLVVILVYSSFRRVATSMLRRISVFIRSGSEIKKAVLKWVVKMDSLRVQNSTTAQHSDRNDCDVTRLVATECVRNKYSLLYFFHSLLQ